MHTNPTSMPQNKAAIIISAYEGHRVDWGIITEEGLRAAIASYQSGKKMLFVVSHFLTVLFPPSSLPSPRKLTSTPPPRRLRGLGGADATITSCCCPKPYIGATTPSDPTETGHPRNMPRMGGGDEPRGPPDRRCHHQTTNVASLGHHHRA